MKGVRSGGIHAAGVLTGVGRAPSMQGGAWVCRCVRPLEDGYQAAAMLGAAEALWMGDWKVWVRCRQPAPTSPGLVFAQEQIQCLQSTEMQARTFPSEVAAWYRGKERCRSVNNSTRGREGGALPNATPV